jgi:hypothetical protein
MNSWCGKHPNGVTFSYSRHSGSLAVRHCESHTEARLRGDRDVDDGIMPMTINDLSAVFWA